MVHLADLMEYMDIHFYSILSQKWMVQWEYMMEYEGDIHGILMLTVCYGNFASLSSMI